MGSAGGVSLVVGAGSLRGGGGGGPPLPPGVGGSGPPRKLGQARRGDNITKRLTQKVLFAVT